MGFQESVYTLVYAQAGLITLDPFSPGSIPALESIRGPVRDARNDWCHCTFVE